MGGAEEDVIALGLLQRSTGQGRADSATWGRGEGIGFWEVNGQCCGVVKVFSSWLVLEIFAGKRSTRPTYAKLRLRFWGGGCRVLEAERDFRDQKEGL